MTTDLHSADSRDYALCPHCGLPTPIRRSMFSSAGTYQSWTKTDGLPEFFLCRQCNRIVGFPAQGVAPLPSIDALLHRPGDDPLLLSEKPIECAGEGCNTRATLYIAWNRETDREPGAKTSKDWILDEFVCPRGHRLPLPW